MDSFVLRREGGMSHLSRSNALDKFIRAYEAEREVRDRLTALDKGFLLSLLSSCLPVANTVLTIVGGFYTVYAGTDCQNTVFGERSRAFLYTSITYTLVSTAMDKALNASLQTLLKRPTLALTLYICQAVVLAGFFTALLTLLVLVITSACPSVEHKVAQRFK